MHTKTQGIVLRETNYREADKILTVLTRDMGKRTVKARGCRRKGSRLAASAQLLVYSDMTLFEYKDRFSMNEADSLEQFWGVRSDLALLALASYFAEVTEAVAEEGRPQPELLSLLLNSVYALDRLNKPPDLVKAAFELRLMCFAGYEPLTDACAVCGREEPVSPRLDLAAGVLRCAACGKGSSVPVPPAVLAAIRHISRSDPKRIFSFGLDPASLRSLGGITEAFLLTQMERPFRTLDFYKGLMLPGRSGI